MITNYEPGDIKLVKANLTSGNGRVSVSILGQIVGVSIFEDIEQPTMACEVVMADAINLVQDFPIVGEERLDISYHTPGRDVPTRLAFKIYKVDGQAASPMTKGSYYTLKGVSPLHMFNAFSNVEKSYKDSISNIVEDILREGAFYTDKKNIRVNVEKTKGIIPITIPRMPPFKAIDMLRQRAISASNASGGSFVFFENQYGYHFKSIESLLTENKNDIASKTFTFSPDTKSDKERKQYAFRNIINYVHATKFDTIDKLQSGHLNTAVQSIDMFTKQSEINVHKMSENISSMTATDKKGSIPNTADFINKYQNNVVKRIFTPKDSSKGNEYIDAYAGIKNIYSSLIGQNSITVLVNGDNYLSVGDVVVLNLPETSGTTERKTKDRMNSGNYLVTRLRHTITMGEGAKSKHLISMDCIKIGYK